MKILFLIKSEKTPSSRIRVEDLVPFLSEHGIEPIVEALPKSFWQRRKLFKKASEYPATVLQKRLLKWADMRALRKHAKFLAFDFDDAIYCRNASPSDNPRNYESATRKKLFRRTLLNSDLIVAANSTLAQKAKQIAPEIPIETIPSTINPDCAKPKSDYSISNPVILGWAGTKSTLRYLDYIAPALRKAGEKHDIILRIIADECREIQGVKIDFIKWSLEEQYSRIRDFDIGIMPLSSDPFSEGKAAYKLIQYMACGVPSVCSPVGMNAEVANNNQNCLTAKDPEEFAGQIIKLIENSSLREKTGRQGREAVETFYSNAAAAKKWAEILKSATQA